MQPGDLEKIDRIAYRAIGLLERFDLMDGHTATFWAMVLSNEISITHREIVPLRLAEFLGADDSNFAHDVFGIHRHLDRGRRHEPARLKDCFVPRFADIRPEEFAL